MLEVRGVSTTMISLNNLGIDNYFKYVYALLAGWLIWGVVRRFLFPHPFDKIPGPAKGSFISGNLFEVFGPNGLEFHHSLTKNYGKVVRTFGLLNERVLFIRDPKALQYIFLKDQDLYQQPNQILLSARKIFGPGLISTLGDQHKRQRKMLNPVFSIAHMKKMIPTFFAVTYDLRDVLLRKIADGPQEVEMVSWLTRVALEIISLCGMGKSFSPIAENQEEHRYISSMKLLGPVGRKLLLLNKYILPWIINYKIGTPRMHRLVADALPFPSLHKICEIIDVMHEESTHIYDSKKKALAAGGKADEEQKDILNILMRENLKASAENKLEDDEVIAQISTLMFGASDTTSSAFVRILWLLAKHQDVQAKLREEIRDAKRFDGEPDYEQLAALTYLDAVCRETLRMYPPAALLSRQALADTILPLSQPIKGTNGKDIPEIHIPRGTVMQISIQETNQDPEIWGPDSGEWKPERWLSPLPDSVLNARIPGVYSHLMTFIGGSKACIGFKFAEMEIKVILYVLIELFQFDLPKKEIFWKFTGLVSPSVDLNELKPQLPVIVSRAL